MVDDGAVVIEFADGNNIFDYIHIYTQGPSGRGIVEFTPQIIGPKNIPVSDEDRQLINRLAGINISDIGYVSA
jgi:hypothetical protein